MSLPPIPLPSTISDMKRHHPISKDDKRTIYDAFKKEYSHQAYVWFILQNESKRQKFISFIKGEAAPTFKQSFVPPLTSREQLNQSNQFSEIKLNLILHSPRGSININRAILACHADYKQIYRPTVRKYRQTSIDQQQIFGKRELPPLKEPEDDSIARHLVQKLFNPEYVELILPIAHTGYPFLSEILKVLDQRENLYPINPLRLHPTMDPYTMSNMTKQKANIDHIQNPTSPRNCPAPIIPIGDPSAARQTGLSSYQEATLESLEEKYQIQKTKKMTPKLNPVPFGPFPIMEPSISPTSAFMRKQLKDGRTLGKENYTILNGPTIL